MLCCVVLCYAVLWCVVLGCVVLYFIVLHCIALYCIVLYCIDISGDPTPLAPAQAASVSARLLLRPGLVIIGLSVGHETWPPIGWHHAFVIGWSIYRKRLPSAHYITVFQTPVTVPLHSPNGRQTPAVRAVQWDCERVLSVSRGCQAACCAGDPRGVGWQASDHDIECPQEHKLQERQLHNAILMTDSRFAPSQWETALLYNDVSHWLSANLKSALILVGSHQCNCDLLWKLRTLLIRMICNSHIDP